jgi:hypothetical protein
VSFYTTSKQKLALKIITLILCETLIPPNGVSIVTNDKQVEAVYKVKNFTAENRKGKPQRIAKC